MLCKSCQTMCYYISDDVKYQHHTESSFLSVSTGQNRCMAINTYFASHCSYTQSFNLMPIIIT